MASSRRRYDLNPTCFRRCPSKPLILKLPAPLDGEHMHLPSRHRRVQQERQAELERGVPRHPQRGRGCHDNAASVGHGCEALGHQIARSPVASSTHPAVSTTASKARTTMAGT